MYSILCLFFILICFHGAIRHKKSWSQNRCLNSPNSRKSLVSYTFSVPYLPTLDINTTVSTCLRWRNSSTFTGMALQWNECWKCCRFYDYRTCNKNYKSWRIENFTRNQTFCVLYFVCVFIFAFDRRFCEFVLSEKGQ